MKRLVILLFLCLLNFPLFANVTVGKTKAVVKVINRLKGISKTLTIPVGSQTLFENIQIDVKACYERMEEVGLESNHWGFLTIQDHERVLFQGWMPSQNRSVATLEHRTYDVWIDSCTD